MKYADIKKSITTKDEFKVWQEETYLRSVGISKAQIEKLLSENVLEKQTRTYSTGRKVQLMPFYRVK